MTITIGEKKITCDECKEQDGRYYIYQGGVLIMSIANILPNMIEADGTIEHVPTPLEEAEAEIEELHEENEEKAKEIERWSLDYMELLADDEAKRARLERIQGLLDALGDTWTLTGLIAFVRSLKDILLGGYGDGED